MSQLTADISRKFKVDNSDKRLELFVDAGATIYAGSGAGVNPATGYTRQLVAGDNFAGFADSQIANVATSTYPNLAINGVALGLVGSASVNLRAAGTILLPTASLLGGIGVTNIGQTVYMSDGNTFHLDTYTQALTETGTPTGGTVTLTIVWNGSSQTTATIAQAATGANVQTAILALTGFTGTTVAGSAGGPWTITWPEGIQPTVTLGTNSLTGGSSPSVTIGALTHVGSNSKIGLVQSFNNANFEVFFQTSLSRLASSN